MTVSDYVRSPLALIRGRRSKVSRSALQPRPLSNVAIIIGALILLTIAGSVTALLLSKYTDGSPEAIASLEVIRTAGTIFVSTGGAAALLLAARRQRWSELA